MPKMMLMSTTKESRERTRTGQPPRKTMKALIGAPQYNPDKLYVGRTVRQIRQMTPSELEREGWEDRHKSTRVIVFTDGSLIYASQDDEGNGPGAMFGIVDGKSMRVPEE
jgi:hypothetical protein